MSRYIKVEGVVTVRRTVTQTAPITVEIECDLDTDIEEALIENAIAEAENSPDTLDWEDEDGAEYSGELD